MGELLSIDLEKVDTTAEKLGFIVTSLRAAETNADEVAGMIPHEGLSGCVSKFGNDWDRARSDLIAKVEDLQKVGKTIYSTFTDTDAELAGAMERK